MAERLVTRERFDIWHEVPLVPQRTEMSCWAAAAAMIVGWRDCLDVAQEDIVRGTGQWASYREGLHPADVADLRRVWRLDAVDDGRVDLPTLRGLLERHGPLWVGEAAPGLHVVTLTGAYGDGTPEGSFLRVNDPWPEGRGERYTLPFAEFARGFRAVADVAGVPACILHAGETDALGRGTRRSAEYHVAYTADARVGERAARSWLGGEHMQTVVIDPGHGGDVSRGGSTPYGARGAQGTLEKDVTLALALRVRSRLAPRVDVRLTREGDENRSLAERAALVRRSGADAFLSLHANDGAPALRGCEAWVHPRALGRSRALAETVQRRLARVTGAGRGVFDGELALLRPDLLGDRAAGCLVEVDYLSDAAGEARLRDGATLDAIADAIAGALEEHLARARDGARGLGAAAGLDDNRYQFEQSEAVRLHVADSLTLAETGNDPKYYARVWYDSDRVNFGVGSWTGARVADLLDTYATVAREQGAEDRLYGFFGGAAQFTAIRDRFRSQGASATLSSAEVAAFGAMGNDAPLREAQRRRRAEDIKGDLDVVGRDGKYPWIDAYMFAISEVAAHVLVHATHQHGGVRDLIAHVVAQQGGDEVLGRKMVDGTLTELQFLQAIGARVVELVKEKYRDGVRARYRRLLDTYGGSDLAYFFAPRAVDAPVAGQSAAQGVTSPRIPTAGRRYGGWAVDDVSVDYRHLRAHGGSVSQPFALDATALQNLCAWNAFDVTPTDETDVVLFGLRGCRLVDDGYDGGFAASVQVSEDLPDHLQNRCVLGVWAVRGPNAGKIALAGGSTMPNLAAVQRYAAGGEPANMMLTGRYLYRVGDHRPAADPLHLKGVFVQGQRIVVLRSRNDDTYDTSDLFDLTTPGDNIHPSRDVTGERFSSEGCQTLRGGGDTSGAQFEHRPPPGWVTFREAAGLTPKRAAASENGRRYTYVLLTGREARLAASGAAAASLRRLRQGSSGPAVSALQTALADPSVPAARRYRGPIDGKLEGQTVIAWVKRQQETDGGAADGIVTPADAAALGFDIETGAASAAPDAGLSLGGGARQRRFGRRAVYGGAPAYREALRGDAGDPALSELHRLVTAPHATPASMNDLVLRANFDPAALTDPAVDVVLHFHGYSSAAGGNADIERDKEPFSGLDFDDPETGAPGRSTPTLAILPRGRKGDAVKDRDGNPTGTWRFSFPGLDNVGVARLIRFALDRVSCATTGRSLVARRIILTAHSGGGAALERAIELPAVSDGSPTVDPHEVHLFDALYSVSPKIAAWAGVHLDRDARALRANGGTPDAGFTASRSALRAFFIATDGTRPPNLALHGALKRALEGAYAAEAPTLCPYFRVETRPSWTGADHGPMPKRLGWQLLDDPARDIAGARRPSAISTCAGSSPTPGDGRRTEADDRDDDAPRVAAATPPDDVAGPVYGGAPEAHGARERYPNHATRRPSFRGS